jgi:hypothetical protein
VLLAERRLGQSSVRAQQLGQTPLHRGGVRLALKGEPQVVQVVLSLVTEGAPVAGGCGQTRVDDVRIVVVVELDHHLLCPMKVRENVFGVGCHEVSEVRRAERRRQPKMDFDVAASRHERADEPQIGDRLVELGINYRPQRRVRVVVAVHLRPRPDGPLLR